MPAKRRTPNFLFVNCPIPEKDQPKYEKKYEVLINGTEPIGHVYLTWNRDWTYDGMDPNTDIPLASRTYAAQKLHQQNR